MDVGDYLVESASEAHRALLGPVRLQPDDGVDYVVPGFSVAAANNLDFLETPAEPVKAEDFFPFLQEGTDDWDDFFRVRKVVAREDSDGRVFVSVTSNVADVVTGVGYPSGAVVQEKKQQVVKRYEVVQLLTDVDLRNKFGLTGGLRASMRNLAVVDTHLAAVKLQEHVRAFQGYEKAVVTVGKYARSWKAARDTVKHHSARFPRSSVSVDAMFVGDKIFIYGEEGRDGWRVFGPANVADLVLAIHRIVQATSCDSTIFSLGPELTILDIDVHDGETVLCPVRYRHAGPHSDMPLSSSLEAKATLSAAQRVRLEELCEACETLAVDGTDCATAVRVSSKYVIVNSHVVDEGGTLTSNGELAVAQRSLSRDLWLARSSGVDVAWHLRTAEVDEQVILCYRRHGELVWGEPVRIIAVGTDIMSFKRAPFMVPGVSGAAVVALRDFALLGIYEGVAMTRALAAVFTPALYSEICSHSEAGDSSHAETRPASETIFGKMQSRGLGKMVESAMAAVVPLYSGDVHVGMAFSNGRSLRTVCDPDVAPLSVAQGQPLVFRRASIPGMFDADSQGLLPEVPAVVRSPAYGEKVFAIGRDDEGCYYSQSYGKVVHVGVNASVFQLKGLTLQGALPLLGSLIVSTVDGAVVGVFGQPKHDGRFGETVMCHAFPEVHQPELARARPEEEIMAIFPYLHTGAWPEGLAMDVVAHASLPDVDSSTQAALAMIGDAAMRTALWVALRAHAVDTRHWQDVFKADQSNVVQAAVCESIGLAKLLRVGGGLVIGNGSKLHSDLLEALAGAVFITEPEGIFAQFCRSVNAVRDSYSEIT